MASIIDQVVKGLPKDAMITETLYEGAYIVLYTKNAEFFLNAGNVVKDLARKYKKRIEVRPDSTISMKPELAAAIIRELVPKEAGLNDISFELFMGRVIIDAEKPGLVIGKSGKTLKEIKRRILWAPVIERTPAINSEIIKTVRLTLRDESRFRKRFLNKIGNRIYGEPKKTSWVRLSALGGFREVGRSCLLLQTPESRVLLDCGVNVASFQKGFPHLDAPEFDINELDAVVVTHAHLDHGGFVPYLYKFGYEGPVYTTAPTRDMMTLLHIDYIDVTSREHGESVYSSNDIKEFIKHSVTLNYGEVTDITPDIRLTLHNAGHILGSAICHLHIGNGLYNVVYTGDLKFAKTRLLDSAQTCFPRAETLIIESTYGLKDDIQPPRQNAEKFLLSVVNKTLERGGKVLVPVLGVGRSQELMVLLESAYRNGDLPKDAKIYVDGMVWDATAIYTAYPEFLSEGVRNLVFRRDHNPFLSDIFNRVGSQAERKEVVSGPPCIITATSGMLTGGPSVEYLRTLADNEKNSMIFINYQAEGSLGNRIQRGWREVPMDIVQGKRQVLKMKMEVHTVDGFSAHSDRNQLVNFVYGIKPRPQRILVNHGESSKCQDLARSLHKQVRSETMAPRNLDVIRLH